MITVNDLKNLSYNTFLKLIEMPSESEGFTKNPERNLRTRLIFPRYERSDEKPEKIRISEQEARFVFCQEIDAYYKEIFYSIETPTENKYSFSSGPDNDKKFEVGRGQSAMSDVSLFEKEENGKMKQVIDIEFKAHNVDRSNISKDLLKLICENHNGLFFHLLESADSGTLNQHKHSVSAKRETRGLIPKYQNWILDLKETIDTSGILPKAYILFAICCLNPAFLISKRVYKHSLIDDPFNQFQFQYPFKKGDKDLDNMNGWDFINIPKKTEN